MKKLLLTISTAAFILAFSSCTKDPVDDLTQEESRIYITNRDDSADFGSYTTFSIADSVAVIVDNKLEEKSLTDADAAFINAVKAQMEQRGYVMVSRNDDPDLGININRVYNTYTGVFSYNNYWGGYYGFWDPYYWGYPGYGYYFPVYYGVYEVQEGALSIDMLDLMNVEKNNDQLVGIWSGLIRGSGIFNAATADSQVQALFDQSPYIDTNP